LKHQKFTKGDKVKAKLGGAQMTVDGYINNPNDDLKREYIRVVCVWQENGKECIGQFKEDALILIKAI